MTNETNALAVIDQQVAAALRSDTPLNDDDKGRLLAMAKYLVNNGLAPKNDTPEAVLAKFMAGKELGLAPMQAMIDLYVVNGQVMGDTRVMASQLRAGNWDYWYEETNTERATVVLQDPKGREHRLTVTYEECHEAGWDQSYGKAKTTWQGGGRAIMLRYRALSQAIRAFAADTLNLRVDQVNVQRLVGGSAPSDAAIIREVVGRLGVTATMGLVLAAADAPAEQIIESQVIDVDAFDASVVEGDEPMPAQPVIDRDLRQPEEVRALVQRVATADQGGEMLARKDRQGAVVGMLEQLFPNHPDAASKRAARYSLLNFLLGKTSGSVLTVGECTALSQWAQVRTTEGKWIVADWAIAEAGLILAQVGVEAGQQELFP